MEMSKNRSEMIHGIGAMHYANEPSVGDYWSDMLTPILIVMRVDNMHVYYCKFKYINEWYSADKSNIIRVTRMQFKNYLCYETGGNATWAEVTPEVWEEWALEQDIKYKHETRPLWC